MSHISTTEQRALAAFRNLFDQLPGKVFDSKVYRLLVVDQDNYLIACSGNRYTVFSIDPFMLNLWGAEASGCVFDHLCQTLKPSRQMKELRFTFDADRKLHQGARNFMVRATTKFNLVAAQKVAATLGLK